MVIIINRQIARALNFKQTDHYMTYFSREQPVNRSDTYKIRQIPHLASPEKISQLNYSYNQIRSIPEHICLTVNLQMLDLSHNKINKIQHIYHLTSLKFINISHNLISDIPTDITNLVQIENIDLGFNKITILNNIRVLKSLFEIRTVHFKGFLEINLEGNEVLKKKGCREIYNKWMNPSMEECIKNRSNHIIYQNTINRTKKRNSKSVELPHKQYSLMQTNRTLQLSQNPRHINSLQLGNDQAFSKNRQVYISCQLMTEKIKMSPKMVDSEQIRQQNSGQMDAVTGLNPSKSQIIGNFNFKDLSGLYPEQSESGNLKEWFGVCSQKIKELNNIFTLIITNEDVKSLDADIKSKMVECSLFAKQLINLSLQSIKLALDNKFTKMIQNQYRNNVTMICESIKQMHKQILKIFNQREYLPIKYYKPWVLHYRQLKQLVSAVFSKINLYQYNFAREQQIQTLVNISPDKQGTVNHKNYTSANQQSGSKTAQINKLDQFLFSKEKQDFLLLSDAKRSNSEKKLPSHFDKEENSCENCLMMKWENNRSKEELKQANQRLQILQKQRCNQISVIKQLQQFKQKYLNLTARQQIIIEELDTLKPSTYQNILLQQAKTIQYMIGIDPLIRSEEIEINRFKSKEIHRSGSLEQQKDKLALNTRISSYKDKKLSSSNVPHNKISEFTIQIKNQQTNNNARGSSYFKHKNVITTVNRTGEQQNTYSNDQFPNSLNKFSNDRQAVGRGRQQIVVSQFNSHANSLSKSMNKDTNKGLIKQIKEFNKKKYNDSLNKSKQSLSKNHKRSYQQSQNTQNDVILISENSDSKRLNHYNSIKISSLKNEETKQHQQLIKSEEIQNLIHQKLSIENYKSSQQKTVEDKSSLNRFGGKIDMKETSFLKKRKNENSKYSQNKENVGHQKINRTKTMQNISQLYTNRYKQHGYIPIDSLQANNYKRYIKYHLRNNIIDILSKKGDSIKGQYTSRQKQLTYLTKSQKLIHKKTESCHFQHQNLTERTEQRKPLNNKSQG